jgi:putative membrane protein
MPHAPRSPALPLALLVIVLATLAWSAFGPFDRATWWMETLPVMAAAPLLVLTYRRFPFTTVSYVWMAMFALVLVVGGHYTYARVPLGDWVQDALGTSRNHYDRMGHTLQGVIPAMVGRELLLRTSPLRPGGWLFTLSTAVALAISALYELVEWCAAVVAGGGAVEFLGTQGDPWDAQADMLCALTGAIVSQLLLARLQDRQLARLLGGSGAAARSD